MEKNGKVEKENFTSKMVEKFVTDLRNGTSVFQQPHEEPFYVKNISSGAILKDINAILVAQGLKDNGKVANLVITQKQYHDNRFIALDKDNTNFIATALYDDSKAYYQKNDKEVVEGKAKAGEHKKDENGNYVEDTKYSFIYAAEDLVKSKFVKDKDENGNFVKYQEDVPKIDKEGNPERYKNDGSYTGFNGETIFYKAGDVILEHKAGSYKGHHEPTNERLAQPQPTYMPKLLNDNDLAPLYQRKNNSGEEILKELLTKGFRGMMQGNFEGVKLTKQDIDAIEKDLISKPRVFRGIANSAWARAEGDKETVARMDEAIKNREAKQQEVNENVKQNTKSKGRS